jgi:hypothetical protein
MDSDIVHLVVDGEYLYATDCDNRLWWCKRIVSANGQVLHTFWQPAHSE